MFKHFKFSLKRSYFVKSYTGMYKTKLECANNYTPNTIIQLSNELLLNTK